MLNLGRDYVAAVVAMGKRDSTESEIVSLGAAGDEYDFRRRGPDQAGNLTAGAFDSGLCPLAKRVDGLSVAHFIPEIGQHRIDDLRRHRGGCAVVEVDTHKEFVDLVIS